MSHHIATLAGAVATPFAGLPMLAQLPAPEAAEFGAWMLSAACLMVIIRQAIALKRDMKEDFREKPAPADTYQTKAAAEEARRLEAAACAATHTAMNKLLDERNERAAEERQETRQAIAGLSARIESVLKMLMNGNRGRGVTE